MLDYQVYKNSSFGGIPYIKDVPPNTRGRRSCIFPPTGTFAVGIRFGNTSSPYIFFPQSTGEPWIILKRCDWGSVLDSQIFLEGQPFLGPQFYSETIDDSDCSGSGELSYSYNAITVNIAATSVGTLLLGNNPKRVTAVFTNPQALNIVIQASETTITPGQQVLTIIPASGFLLLPYRDWGPLIQQEIYGYAGGFAGSLYCVEVYKL